MTNYFGKKIVILEKKIFSYNNTFILYEKYEHEISNRI